MRKDGKPEQRARRASVMLYPQQLAAMRAAANERALRRGAGRADVSSILREAVDEWMSRQGRAGATTKPGLK